MPSVRLDERPPKGHIGNDGLREAFLASEINAGELARRLGYYRVHRYKLKDGQLREFEAGDAAPVKVALGLKLGSGEKNLQRHVRIETALRYAEALNLDPVDLGL